MKRGIVVMVLLSFVIKSYCWGFYAHKLVNYYAVFLLPPEMMPLYKKNVAYIEEHAVDPDKRRYAIVAEAPRHFIDMDHYGPAPYDRLPRKWADAVVQVGRDSLEAHGIVPWWIQVMLQRLTRAFREGNQARILKTSAELGHYLADAHVPLHASSNYNGQFTHQQGIHGFWESRVPELLAERNWDFVLGRAGYIAHPLEFSWDRVLESAAEADSVLSLERQLNEKFAPGRKYAFEERSGKIIKQYSTEYASAYNELLNDMAERRFRQSVYATASFWYTAWVDAGRPDLHPLTRRAPDESEQRHLDALEAAWNAGVAKGRPCD